MAVSSSSALATSSYTSTHRSLARSGTVGVCVCFHFRLFSQIDTQIFSYDACKCWKRKRTLSTCKKHTYLLMRICDLTSQIETSQQCERRMPSFALALHTQVCHCIILNLEQTDSELRIELQKHCATAQRLRANARACITNVRRMLVRFSHYTYICYTSVFLFFPPSTYCNCEQSVLKARSERELPRRPQVHQSSYCINSFNQSNDHNC